MPSDAEMERIIELSEADYLFAMSLLGEVEFDHGDLTNGVTRHQMYDKINDAGDALKKAAKRLLTADAEANEAWGGTTG